MSYIRVNGDQFEINGQVRPYKMRTSFCLLAHYQRRERDKGRRWLDRIQSQGFDGPRLFGENQDWEGGPFFGTEWTPKIRAFGDHSGPFSQLELLPGYKELVAQLGEDLQARNMIAEFCCVATIKGREAGWTGQGLNKFAQMFRELFPDPDNTPFLHETVNEIDAHSHPTLMDPDEWRRMGPRWRRSAPEDPSHHNYPGSTIGVSAGGQFAPGFDDLNYTHRNIHPPRGDNWDAGQNGDMIRATVIEMRRRTASRPLAFNETVHYMTQAEWDYWVASGKISKWAGLSTTEHVRLQKYTADVLSGGASFTGHDLIGMETNPDAPESPMELAWRELFGGTTPAPVTGPSPVKRYRYKRVIDLAYEQILDRKVDESGLEAYNNFLSRGGTESSMRAALLRSVEYNEKNPE